MELPVFGYQSLVQGLWVGVEGLRFEDGMVHGLFMGGGVVKLAQEGYREIAKG